VTRLFGEVDETVCDHRCLRVHAAGEAIPGPVTRGRVTRQSRLWQLTAAGSGIDHPPRVATNGAKSLNGPIWKSAAHPCRSARRRSRTGARRAVAVEWSQDTLVSH
jgi:hypothetical protein